jgi:hypothetical protein
MTATNHQTGDTNRAPRKDLVALFGVLDTLKWRHVTEMEEEKETGNRILICAAYLSKVELVLTTGKVGLEPKPNRPQLSGQMITFRWSGPEGWLDAPALVPNLPAPCPV